MVMSSRIIPKERLFSYQRWQMDAFEPEQPLAPQLAGEEWQHRGGDSAGGAGIDQAGARSAGEQIEQARQQAKLEGYAAGHEAGREAGHESGYQAGHDAGYQAGYQSGNEQARAEASQLEALLH